MNRPIADRILAQEFCVTIMETGHKIVDRIVTSTGRLPKGPDWIHCIETKNQLAFHKAELHFISPPGSPISNDEKRRIVELARTASAEALRLKDDPSTPANYAEQCAETYAWCLKVLGDADDAAQAKQIVISILNQGCLPSRAADLKQRYGIADNELSPTPTNKSNRDFLLKLKRCFKDQLNKYG